MSKEEITKLCAEQATTWPDVGLAFVVIVGIILGLYVVLRNV